MTRNPALLDLAWALAGVLAGARLYRIISVPGWQRVSPSVLLEPLHTPLILMFAVLTWQMSVWVG
jgi:hypothetical protein